MRRVLHLCAAAALAMASEARAAPGELAPPAQTEVGLKLGFVPGPSDETTGVRGLSAGLLGDRVARVTGAQLALFYDRIDGSGRGLQLTLGFAFADADFHGAQVAGLASFAKAVTGLQLAAGLNVASRAKGVQLALVNDGGDADGAQLGALNTAVRLRGARVGLYNCADELWGFEAGLINVARETHGVQIGLVNAPPFPVLGQCATDDDAAGRQTHGLQLGLVNVADQQEGVSVALINVARSGAGESLALVNLVGDGVHHVALYASDALLANVELKLGGRHLYTGLIAGFQPGDDAQAGPAVLRRETRRRGLGLAIGWYAPLERGRLRALDVALTASRLGPSWELARSDLPTLASLRVGACVGVTGRLALLAALSWNVVVATNGGDADLGLGVGEVVSRTGTTTVRAYPGAVIGVQL